METVPKPSNSEPNGYLYSFKSKVGDSSKFQCAEFQFMLENLVLPTILKGKKSKLDILEDVRQPGGCDMADFRPITV